MTNDDPIKTAAGLQRSSSPPKEARSIRALPLTKLNDKEAVKLFHQHLVFAVEALTQASKTPAVPPSLQEPVVELLAEAAQVLGAAQILKNGLDEYRAANRDQQSLG